MCCLFLSRGLGFHGRLFLRRVWPISVEIGVYLSGIWWFGFNRGCCFLFRFNFAYKFLKESFRGDVIFVKKFFKKFFEIRLKAFLIFHARVLHLVVYPASLDLFI